MKTPEDIRKEIYVFVDSLPLIDPKDLKVGQTFVTVGYMCRRVFGCDSFNQEVVVSKTKTLIRTRIVLDSIDALSNLTFKGAEKTHTVLALASMVDVSEVRSMVEELNKASLLQERRQKNMNDVFALWNYAVEDDKEGFVLEVFNGNGELLERIRMLNEYGCFEYPTFDSIERMVRAYVGAYFEREHIRTGSKFQIQYVPEMD